MDLTVRTITADEYDDFLLNLNRTFGGDPSGEGPDRFRSLLPPDRTVAAFDGETMVGTGGGFPLELTVPGGQLAMSGTTVVTVRPTHRRKGVLTAMMRFHLDDAREREEPLAGLWASESAIYGRYGYGSAVDRHETEVDGRTVQFIGEAPAGQVQLVEIDEAKKLAPGIHDRVRRQRPGMFARTELWWEHRLFYDPERWRDGASSRRWVFYFDAAGNATGYVAFRQKEKWEEQLAGGSVFVTELLAVDDEAHTGLWRFLTGVDLFPIAHYWSAPVDDPLPWKVNDRRRVQRKRYESLWLRLLDVPAALEARAYEGAGRMVLGLTDAFYPDLAGSYSLEAGPGGASCERTDAEPDLVMDIADLGSIYLGGHRASTLARAGRITGTPDVIAAADRIFGWSTTPWCPEVF